MQNGSVIQEYLFNITNDSYTDAVDPTMIFGPQRDDLLIIVPITIIYVLIFVTGLFGNIFTCIVIIRNKSMHTATNYYLFSLAISDLLLLVSGMPQEMYSIWSKWPYVFGAAFCILRGLAAETSTNASVLTITLFTIERYLAICHPFQSYRMSKLTRACKHIVLLWLVALGTALPLALQFGIKQFKGVTMCLQTQVIIEHSFEISTFLFFFTPMILIVVLYGLIALHLYRSRFENMHCKQNGESRPGLNMKLRRKVSRSTRKVVRMLVAVVIAFFICWAPFHAQRLVAIYGTNEHHKEKAPGFLFLYSVMTYSSGVFYYLSTTINPILYHTMSNKFRDAFKNTLFRACGIRHRPIIQQCSYTAVPFKRNRLSSGSDNLEKREIGSRCSRNKGEEKNTSTSKSISTVNGSIRLSNHEHNQDNSYRKYENECVQINENPVLELNNSNFKKASSFNDIEIRLEMESYRKYSQ